MINMSENLQFDTEPEINVKVIVQKKDKEEDEND